MTYEVRTEHADGRPLAAVRATVDQRELGSMIISSLDKIWPVVREQGVRTGHNVVIYREGSGQALHIDVGVEVPDGFAPQGEILPVATPSGEVATATHFGEYSEMMPAYVAIERWCADNGRQQTGVRWEVYGDWSDDPAQRRTDVYFGLAEA